MSRIALNVDSYEGNDTPSVEIARFVVLYGKASTRKHKIWEGDGLLVCYGDSCMLKSEDDRDVICRSSALKNLDQLEDGRVINIGSWSVQIQERIATKTGRAVAPPSSSEPMESMNMSTASSIIPKSSKFKAQRPPMVDVPAYSNVQMDFEPIGIERKIENPGRKRNSGQANLFLSLETPRSLPKRSTFVPPLIDDASAGTSTSAIQEKLPPFILNEQDILDRKTTSAVVVDPRFARHLREHQKEGIKFIFNRLKNEMGGAVLADEMGLGKSIQTMAATWALMRGSKATQIAQSCLIIVPSSLVNNWKSEFDKWWRLMRFPAVIATTVKDIQSYQTTVKTMPYLVISYDLAQRHAGKLRDCRFDMMVCDEGHKLKNLKGRLRKTLVSLEIPRRLILTGTPMQNDFEELFSLLNFVCPLEFDSHARIREMYRGGDTHTLNKLIDQCMLRRTSFDIDLKHLPEKHEYILFCAASEIQQNIHSEICDYMTGDPLSLIFFARQLANHPKLLLDNLRDKNEKSGEKSLKQAQKHAGLLLAFDGPNMPRGAAKESGKLYALADMIKCFRMLQECTVVVSNYIETLDMIEQLCTYLEFRVFRLDGKTQVQDRQKLVRQFNDQREPSNIFLLSTKAGGVGLNLIGASRLVLYDSDWNPANDQQAMARIWRDGQVRPCHIYRLITTGTIEEKMLQRQIKKTGLGCVIDAIEVGDTISTFSEEDLKDIFTFTGDQTECNTHDLCECTCDGTGMLEIEIEDEQEEEDETSSDEDSDDSDSGGKSEAVKKARNWDSDDDEEVDDEELEGDVTMEKPEQKPEEDDDEVVPDSPEIDRGSPDCFPELTRENKALRKKEARMLYRKRIKEKPVRTVATLAELSRWRHFSPRHPETWEYFMRNAGLSNVDSDVNLTFAFSQESQF